MLDKIKQVYERLPKEKMKFLKMIPDNILLGKSYLETKDKITYDKKYLVENLHKTLNYAREHTLYGKENIPKVFSIHESKQVLESLPIVTAYELATNLEYYVSDEFNKLNSYYTTTGGTGRNPTTLLHSNELYGIEWAYVHDIWALAGYDRKKNTKLTLRGKSFKGDKLSEYSPLHNELVVDSFKMNDKNFQKLMKDLEKFNIEYIHGYPSLIKEYMGYFEKYNYKPDIKGILLASEGVSPDDKKMIRDFFGCKVISFYGQTERLLFAYDDNCSGEYKISTSYGYPRVVDGELVGTSFVNRALPLINYKIGDGAELIEKDDFLYLKNLSSRRGKDFVYLNRQKRISMAPLTLHSMIQNEVLYYQIHQNEFGKITIKILKKPTSKMNDSKIIREFEKEMHGRLKDFEVKAFIVNSKEITKSHRGKMILLVQDLDLS